MEYIFYILVILLILVGGFLTWYLQRDDKDTKKETSEDKQLKNLYSPLTFLGTHFRNKIEQFKNKMIPLGTPMYVGDSITEGWEAQGQGLLEDLGIKIRGVSGDTSYGVRLRFTSNEYGYTHLMENPSKIFLQIGTNDLGFGANKYLVDRIEDIFKVVKDRLPNTQLYFISIPPINTNFPGLTAASKSNNKLINEKNSEIQKLTLRYGYTYIDINSILKDADGNLNIKYTGDGVHFNRTAYELVYDIIKNYV